MNLQSTLAGAAVLVLTAACSPAPQAGGAALTEPNPTAIPLTPAAQGSMAPPSPAPTIAPVPVSLPGITADLTDSDGDGMTDRAELKYGFDPNDAASFPAVPEYVQSLPSTPHTPGAAGNRISYTFASCCLPADISRWDEFLRRVWPLLYHNLGPPGENMNVVINHSLPYGSAFLTVDRGRTLLSDGTFLPRLLVHELVHAWKGRYLLASHPSLDWEYATDLAGFEEATGEGMAYVIVQEYVRSYPSDSATIQLLSNRPGQYWSDLAPHYDAIKNLTWTGGGDLWTHPSGFHYRYAIAAVTMQQLVATRPTFMADFMALYYARIRSDPAWRPSRADLVALWEQLVPALNGSPLSDYLDTLPVFNGRPLARGFYIVSNTKFRGGGEQQFALGFTYDGYQLLDPDKVDLTCRLADPDRARSFGFVVTVTDANGGARSFEVGDKMPRNPAGTTDGLLWYRDRRLELRSFPIGLYKARVEALGYEEYGTIAEEYYFFGLQGLAQGHNEYVIMVGIDGVAEGEANISLLGRQYSAAIRGGAAVFRSKDWPQDLADRLSITVTNGQGTSRTYQRTLLEAATLDGFSRQQFIVVDADFDGVEDLDARKGRVDEWVDPWELYETLYQEEVRIHKLLNAAYEKLIPLWEADPHSADAQTADAEYERLLVQLDAARDALEAQVLETEKLLPC